jgi:hypothetical protein
VPFPERGSAASSVSFWPEPLDPSRCSMKIGPPPLPKKPREVSAIPARGPQAYQYVLFRALDGLREPLSCFATLS